MQEIIQKLKTHLANLKSVQAVYMYPLKGTPAKFPAIICLTDGFDNRFETTQDNFKIYTFQVWLYINTAGKTEEQIWETILPKATDEFIAYMDSNWNFGTLIDGHRVWSRVSGGFFRMEDGEKSHTAVSEMTLQIKFMKAN